MARNESKDSKSKPAPPMNQQRVGEISLFQ